MGVYAYCSKCDAGLAKPTANEIADDDWRCYAGHANALREDRVALLCSVVSDQEAHIDALERNLSRIADIVAGLQYDGRNP